MACFFCAYPFVFLSHLMAMDAATYAPGTRLSPSTVGCGCCGVLRVGRWLGGRALPQTRKIATAAMAAITSNSLRAGRFIGSDSSGVAALVSDARLSALAPDGMSIMISNSHARTRRAPSLRLISHLHVTKPLSSRRRSGGTRPPAEPLPFRLAARCKVSRGSLTGRSDRSQAREARDSRQAR